ncbi:MAG: fasciclin domain-containing protein [Syntrophales bacterium]
MRDIINTAIEAGSVKMLVSAIQAAELVDTLRSIGLFTVFAPDDEAFAKLPKGAYDGLLKNVPQLKTVLMYHIIPGKHTINEISKMNTAKTLQGQEVKIDAHKWHLHANPKINDANITNYNVEADNGMIHVLDRVLMPNMELTCPVCGMGFTTVEALNAHTKMGHVVEKVSETMLPAETMPEVEKATKPMSGISSQETPLRGLEPNQIQCPDCGKTFKSHSEMERHRDTTHHETKGHE